MSVISALDEREAIAEVEHLRLHMEKIRGQYIQTTYSPDHLLGLSVREIVTTWDRSDYPIASGTFANVYLISVDTSKGVRETKPREQRIVKMIEKSKMESRKDREGWKHELKALAEFSRFQVSL